jgi:hypothetical protein
MKGRRQEQGNACHGAKPWQNTYECSHQRTHETVKQVKGLKGDRKAVGEAGECIHRFLSRNIEIGQPKR